MRCERRKPISLARFWDDFLAYLLVAYLLRAWVRIQMLPQHPSWIMDGSRRSVARPETLAYAELRCLRAHGIGDRNHGDAAGKVLNGCKHSATGSHRA